MLPKVSAFCFQHETELLGKKLGLYLCAINEEAFAEEMERTYSEALHTLALCKKAVRGEFKTAKPKFILFSGYG